MVSFQLVRLIKLTSLCCGFVDVDLGCHDKVRKFLNGVKEKG